MRKTMFMHIYGNNASLMLISIDYTRLDGSLNKEGDPITEDMS